MPWAFDHENGWCFAVFGQGFKLFFPAASLWAAGVMMVWFGALSGYSIGAVSPAWHAHEMLFAYTSAVLAGFLLTAVPNWTNRPPLRPRIVWGLFALWLAGRGLMAWGDSLLGAIVDVAFLGMLALVIGAELMAAGNRRNFVIVALVVGLALTNVGFHLDAYLEGVQSVSLRLALVLILLLIMLIGGRIIPNFTRNWLCSRDPGVMPRPFGRFDLGVLLVSAVVLAGWVIQPEAKWIGVAMLLVGAGHCARCGRWAGHRTLSEPLLAVLHGAYLFIPAGFLALGAAVLMPGAAPESTAMHLWMTGAIGLMTTAVMSRAVLGHTGSPLRAGRAHVLGFLLIAASASIRYFSGFSLDPTLYIAVSAIAWIGGFLVFSLLFVRQVVGRNGGGVSD